jgi:hypothetical protein
MNRTYTDTGVERTTYVDRKDNLMMKMVLPFIIGLALGWGANEIADNTNDRTDRGAAQTDGRVDR